MRIQPIQLVLLLLAFLFEFRRGVTISGCIPNERNALLNFKESLIDKHNRLTSWNGDGCCNWEGVSCNNVTGHVVKLNLRNPRRFSYDDNAYYNEWSLKGHLSPSLLGLKQLNHLDLSMNHFDGPIPKFLGSLRNLRYLNLSLAGFHGLIPHHLGNLSKLEYLDLNNGLIGYSSEAIIDDSRWISHLTSLKHLTMKNTNFKSFRNWMEALNELPNIAELCLSSSNISDFPFSLPYVNFTNLSYLDLSDNNLITQGIVPLWLFNIKSLTHIDLSYNFFGLIPNALKNLTSLQYIDFSYNNFSGCLPDCFGEMHKLKTLDLRFNYLFGSIPESFGHLVALQELHLSFNYLNGTVPKSIGQLSNLVYLYLDETSLEGDMSEVHFTRLGKLKHLNLHSTNLILNVSHDWIPPFKLDFIDMGSCRIGPDFPQWLKSQVNLSFLDLSSSDIVDILPDWFWDVFVTHDVNTIYLDLSNNGIIGKLPPLSKLSFDYFDLSNNSFSGSVQPMLGNITMAYLGLSRNNFSGEIPLSICLAGVTWIDFSWNLLTGELPNCWNPLAYANQYQAPLLFDFSKNNLYGTIPPSLGTLTNLKSLHLSYNNLSGMLPMTLRNCVSLRTLDLSMNSLTGIIPTWVGDDLTELKALILRSNNFTGNVPSNLSKLKELRILDLANNKLTGRIPWSFGNFRGMMDMNSYDENEDILESYFFPVLMEYVQLTVKKRDWNYDKLLSQVTIVDLSFNNLSEQIPKKLGNLHSLRFLNLSRNHLVGSIPDAIGLMHSLESLDLSINELSGNIPPTMSTMTALSLLNLSYNNLYGKIPSGTQLQTFGNESYIGNPKLCGIPLSQSCDSNKPAYVEVLVDEVTISDYWYVSIAPGFVLGVWLVWGTLFVKKKWRKAFFRYVDYVYDAIYVVTTVNINRIKRKIGKETALE